MTKILIIILGLCPFNTVSEIDRYVNHSTDLEKVYSYFSYRWCDNDYGVIKSSEVLLHKKKGNCKDFALFTYNRLRQDGYDVTLFLTGNLIMEHIVCAYHKGNDYGIFSNYKRFSNYDIKEYCKEQGYMIYEIQDIESEVQ